MKKFFFWVGSIFAALGAITYILNKISEKQETEPASMKREYITLKLQ